MARLWVSNEFYNALQNYIIVCILDPVTMRQPTQSDQIVRPTQLPHKDDIDFQAD